MEAAVVAGFQAPVVPLLPLSMRPTKVPLTARLAAAAQNQEAIEHRNRDL